MMERMAALIAALCLVTIASAFALVLLGGWTWRKVWQVWWGGVLFAATLGKRGSL